MFSKVEQLRAEKLEIDQQLRTFQHSGQGEGRVRSCLFFACTSDSTLFSPLNWRTVMYEAIVEEAEGEGVKVEEEGVGAGWWIRMMQC